MGFDSTLKNGRALRIAHAEPSDAAEIVAYLDRVSGESDFLTFGSGEFGVSVEDETTHIANLEGGRFNFMLKGVIDGQIVSVCTIFRSDRPRLRHIGEFGISVAKSYWGFGVGKRMCRAMLEVARLVGVTKVDLMVREDNVNAIRLYESVGFVREGVKARAIRIGDWYFGQVTMGMSLD